MSVNLIKRHQSSDNDDLTDPDITDPEITRQLRSVVLRPNLNSVLCLVGKLDRSQTKGQN